MIATLEIDDALAEQAERAAKARGISFREFIRAAIRQALNTPCASVPAPFAQPVHDFGAHLESPWTALAELETEEYALKFLKK